MDIDIYQTEPRYFVEGAPTLHTAAGHYEELYAQWFNVNGDTARIIKVEDRYLGFRYVFAGHDEKGVPVQFNVVRWKRQESSGWFAEGAALDETVELRKATLCQYQGEAPAVVGPNAIMEAGAVAQGSSLVLGRVDKDVVVPMGRIVGAQEQVSLESMPADWREWQKSPRALGQDRSRRLAANRPSAVRTAQPTVAPYRPVKLDPQRLRRLDEAVQP